MKSRTKLGYAVGAAIVFLTFMLVIVSASNEEDPGYVDRERERTYSWLTVAGLYWLREGARTGSGRLPAMISCSLRAQRLLRWVCSNFTRKATFHAEDGVTITRDGKPIQPKQIVELEMGEKHAIAINDLKMWLHYSGERLAIVT